MKNILIIAGHGGSSYDPGACGCGQKEAVLTRELARLAQTELQKISGVKAALYDINNDAYKILKNGGSLPLDGVSYVLELHFNEAANDEHGNGKTTGAEVLVHTSESGVTVEESICKHIAALGFKNPAQTPAKPEQIPTKPAQTPNLKEQFDGLYNIVNPLYTSLEQVPSYWREDVSAMMKSGAIKGDGKHEISMGYETLHGIIAARRMMINDDKKV